MNEKKDKTKKLFTFLLLPSIIVVLGFLGIRHLYYASYPACPTSWQAVQVGLTRGEVYSKIGRPHIDMLELKGFEIYRARFEGNGIWSLNVYYKSKELESKVTDYWIEFIDPSNGLRNVNEQNPGADFFALFSN